MNHVDVVGNPALAGRVKRYHTWPTICQQSVGEHTDRVMALYLLLFGVPRVEVLIYIHRHDKGELLGGDIPHYAKRTSEMLKTGSNEAEAMGLKLLRLDLPVVTPQEHGRIKLCDYLEAHEFATIEMRMGNRYGLPVCENIDDAVNKLVVDSIEPGRLRDAVNIYRKTVEDVHGF